MRRSRVSVPRVRLARDRPGRKLFAAPPAISVIFYAFRGSGRDARAPSRPFRTRKLGVFEFLSPSRRDLGRIARFYPPVPTALRPTLTSSPLAISSASQKFSRETPHRPRRPHRYLNARTLRIRVSGESPVPVRPFDTGSPGASGVARSTTARFRARCHPWPTLPPPRLFWQPNRMSIVTGSMPKFTSAGKK